MKLTHHIKNQVKLKLNESVDVNTEMTEILELSDRAFKAVIIKMLQWAST